MTSRFVLTALALLLLSGPLRAQTPLGQPSLDESKVQIWCATVRFVYDDAGRPNLKSTVRCEGGNLDALAASIRPDSLRVYSVLYQSIEGRGAIYQGKKDNPARLAALTKAIVSKLKSSPARRKDPARMARVAALETALTNYVTSGTPLGEVSAAMAPETADTAAAPGAPGPAEAAEAQAAAERDAAGTSAAALPATGPGSLLYRFAAPLALILGILSLVLYIMLRVTLGQWRRQQRRETLLAKQAATAAQAAAAETSAAVADSVARVKRAEALVLAAAPEANNTPATPVLDQLSPAQRLEVERLVSQRVDEELRWLRANLPELVASAISQPSAAAGPTAAPDATPRNPGSVVADDVQMD
ncbi:hypothetical protein KB206_17095 [Microvirga sp. STS02]|uniref:hypothetical protein n=1 Tax=Hymenobacter negativus TaxID=2795026 RepID=UPI0018DBE263|nr:MULTISPECIES: hypothetical protein [Bacteria]MBH8570612.1 hypothetical protein [Hymenobacter negativus]MBR7210350.1 hypothetical protein [Microvirga sp. STS02]